MRRARFEQLVAEAIRTIPARFRDELHNIAVMVEDEPPDDLLDEMEIDPPDTLFGLYQGTPLTERRWDHGNTLPDRIVLYQGPIEDSCESEDD
ncbi:MAG: metallopeptidase family protein, partial [Acidobacteria bacterium]|nr:metallopeptidase family protein [Acidobacteriota bacterium]